MGGNVYSWRKSSYTAKDECVEVLLAETVGVRDTKARHLGQLAVSRAAWSAFLSVVEPPREDRR
ncbi:DUF397 domain-containing protein [Amycolatopsis plumensis]|uniref:DUF397 domain-containing protein n=1 Tax=Amycolatopsis plumensis TaxID=236508 RepID=A0ABV5UD01_9PSEU